MKPVIVYGGFSATKYFYAPFRKRLQNALSTSVDLAHPAPWWDLFGFNAWPAQYTIADFEQRVAAFPPQSVTLIGHSLGGYQALVSAFRHTELIDKIYLLACPIWGSPHAERGYEYAIRQVMHVSDKFVEQIRQFSTRIARRIVTIYYRADMLAPEICCYIPGARNYCIGETGSHLLFVYARPVISIIQKHVSD